jgi:hypothetical protein
MELRLGVAPYHPVTLQCKRIRIKSVSTKHVTKNLSNGGWTHSRLRSRDTCKVLKSDQVIYRFKFDRELDQRFSYKALRQRELLDLVRRMEI